MQILLNCTFIIFNFEFVEIIKFVLADRLQSNLIQSSTNSYELGLNCEGLLRLIAQQKVIDRREEHLCADLQDNWAALDMQFTHKLQICEF